MFYSIIVICDRSRRNAIFDGLRENDAFIFLYFADSQTGALRSGSFRAARSSVSFSTFLYRVSYEKCNSGAAKCGGSGALL